MSTMRSIVSWSVIRGDATQIVFPIAGSAPRAMKIHHRQIGLALLTQSRAVVSGEVGTTVIASGGAAIHAGFTS